MHRITKIIEKADIDQVCNPHTGDCVSVAVAINEVFNGDKYVCCYETLHDTTPIHATVEIDGILFDGSGPTHMESLYDLIISGAKEKELSEDLDEHIGYPTSLEKTSLYDESVKERVKEQLVSAKS